MGIAHLPMRWCGKLNKVRYVKIPMYIKAVCDGSTFRFSRKITLGKQIIKRDTFKFEDKDIECMSFGEYENKLATKIVGKPIKGYAVFIADFDITQELIDEMLKPKSLSSIAQKLPKVWARPKPEEPVDDVIVEDTCEIYCYYCTMFLESDIGDEEYDDRLCTCVKA